LDRLGAFFGIVGAILIATNISLSKYAFIVFALSSVFWIINAYKEELHSLLWMNVVFLVVDAFGIYRWILV
jgi:hypothetical protein